MVVGMGPHESCLICCLQVPQVEWSAFSCKSSCLRLRQLRQLPASRVFPSPPEAWQSELGAVRTCLSTWCHAHLASVEQRGYNGCLCHGLC